jgi:putative ATP-dependent endonuclease of the OLD family
LDLRFLKGKNIIVGRNNSGKSNIIKAINIVLGENNPTYAKAENITKNDFYSWKVKHERTTTVECSNEMFIWCELTRDPDECLNYDEMSKCYSYPIYTSYIYSKISKLIKKEELAKNNNLIFDLCEDNSNKSWVKPENRDDLEIQFEDKYSFAFAFKATRDNKDDILKEIRFLYRENENSDWVLSFRAPIRNEFLQSAIMTSFRDPQNQLRLTKWTWYGKLMHHLTTTSPKTTDLIDALDGIKDIGDEIFRDVKERIESSSLSVAFPGTELRFQFNVDSKDEMYKNCLIYVDDGFTSQLTDKGSGIQSATIIGLFNYYTRYVNTVTSALLCIEEPELYLHPHGCRVISNNIEEFLNDDRNQVILTTHSVEFIRITSKDLNLIMVYKEGNATNARSVDIGKYKKVLVDKKQNEIFFADKVIVCEGNDEFVLTFIAKELFPKVLDTQNISVIAVGGKDQIHEFVKLVLTLGIKCFILADFDYLLRDPPNHKSIMNLCKEFFGQDCIFGSDGRRAISKIEILRTKLRGNNKELFTNGKTSDDFDDAEVPIFLKYLRDNGVGILTGEIENCSKDYAFISPNKKLTLEKIYELNERMINGAKITDLLDVSEIKEFLEIVIER